MTLDSEYELDRLDRRIILELDRDARQSYSALGKKLHLGSDLVLYRIQKMLRLGVLQQFSALIDASRLGFSIFRSYLKLIPEGRAAKRFLRQAVEQPRTQAVRECFGHYDFSVSSLVRTPQEFEAIQGPLVRVLGDTIADLNVAILTKIWRYPRKYLLDGSAGRGYPPRLSVEPTVVDALEQKLLQQISINCRTSITDLARLLKTTPAVVSYRLQRLEKEGVIGGYRTKLNFEKLGILMVRLSVGVAEFDPAKEQQLEQLCRSTPSITNLVRLIGPWQYEIDVEASGIEELQRVQELLRETFPRYIRRVDFVVLRQEHCNRLPDLSQ